MRLKLFVPQMKTVIITDAAEIDQIMQPFKDLPLKSVVF